MAIGDSGETVKLDPAMQDIWILRGRALFDSMSYVTGVSENFSGVDTRSKSGTVSEGTIVYGAESFAAATAKNSEPSLIQCRSLEEAVSAYEQKPCARL
jgi:hypothetical protein